MVIVGTDNFAYNYSATGAIFGYKNYGNTSSYMFGTNNTSTGWYGVTIGYQNGVIGNSGVAIGSTSIAGIVGVSVGSWAFANDAAIALGGQSLALGPSSLALGYMASAGAMDAINIYKNSDDGYGSGWTTNQEFSELQKDFPEIYGTYDANQSHAERNREVKQKIFELNKAFFTAQGINSVDDLISKASKYNNIDSATADTQVDSILSQLGWKYAVTQKGGGASIAIGREANAASGKAVAAGFQSEASVAGSVGLGAFSRATENDMVDDGTKGAFSNIVLSTEGTAVNGINEYLLGPVAIGGKQVGNESAIYLRQLKYLADGTDDTDAVNLRQLKEAVKNSGNSGGDDNNGGGNTGSSIVYEAGDNITITDKEGNSSTKIISATGITEIKDQVKEMGEKVNTLDGRVSKLDGRVDKVGAGAAALAALHPLDYDPDDKLDVSAGYGHYAGASAVALGAYYRPNEDIMFSIGGSFGNGEEMMNAGVSLKVGSGKSGTTTSKTAMARRIQELEMNNAAQQERLAIQDEKLARQDQKLANQNERLAKQETEIQELKEMIKKLAK